MVTPPSGPELTTYSPPQTLLLIPWPTECEFPIRHCSTCLISFATVNLLLSHPSSYLSLSDPSFEHHQIKVRGPHCVTGRQCPSPAKERQWFWVTYATKHQRTWWLLNRVPWWELKERASERVGQLHPYCKIAPCIVSFDQGSTRETTNRMAFGKECKDPGFLLARPLSICLQASVSSLVIWKWPPCLTALVGEPRRDSGQYSCTHEVCMKCRGQQTRVKNYD